MPDGRKTTVCTDTLQALRESEAFNASLLRGAPNPILVLNEDNSIRFVNPAFVKITGVSKKELVGITPPFPWWPEDKISRYWNENISGRGSETNGLERLIKHKKGRLIWISISIRYVRQKGSIKYILSIWTDIDKLKKVEQALKESETFNSRLLNDAPNPITVIDAEKRFKYVNPAFEKLTGYSATELLGKNCVPPWWPPERVQEYLAIGRENMHEDVTFHERLLRKKNGEPFWADISIRPVKENGKLLFKLCNWVDIPYRKKIEENLNSSYQKERSRRKLLEEETRLRNLFIDVLAHELRTPITPILSSTEMLKDIIENSGDALQKKLINNIAGSSTTLAKRLEELLDMARQARRAFTKDRRPVDISRFIKEVVTRFRPALRQTGQKLKVQIQENLPVASLDASRLEQVIINLLANASKFSADGSHIYLKAGMAEDWLTVEVIDEGIGIPKSAQDQLFQPYYRVEPGRRHIRGLGLGLAVSKQIIEAHGGLIWVNSEEGRGSSFCF
jgi:PAS domain S-box-containing protein